MLSRRSMKRFLMTPAIIRTPGLLMPVRMLKVEPVVPIEFPAAPAQWGWVISADGSFWYNGTVVKTTIEFICIEARLAITNRHSVSGAEWSAWKMEAYDEDPG